MHFNSNKSLILPHQQNNYTDEKESKSVRHHQNDYFKQRD